ncbi:MAG: glycoside hydrolase family 2 protein [Anaerolineae bacterium]|nr:hypothetical protein [Thermoflexales bacterium]MDW8406452.1 glycoside hydrolase family 2 protein [Anaerolineae bacterium]
MKETLLNGEWALIDEPLTTLPQDAERVLARTEGWMSQPVPGDIHQGLMAAGRIRDPLLGLNSFDCAWTEDRSWWFRKIFPTEPAWLASDAVELELNGLDANASIFLNGHHLGDHRSAFYPFVTDIKTHLNVGGHNTLLVRLTTGVEGVTSDMLAALGVPVSTEAGNGRPERGDQRRVFVRKPQYSFGWDWSPRVATTAIAGDVKVRAFNTACIRDVRVLPHRLPDADITRAIDVRVTVTVDFLHYFKTGEGTLRLTLYDADRRQVLPPLSKTVLLRSGLNFIDFALHLNAPRLWWPNGLGAQHRYVVQVELRTQRERAVHTVKAGLRFIDLIDRDRFAFVVNDRNLFCKGANWIPADTLYARVTSEKYDQLVREAQCANFNMLRVWGGGLYEPEAFYDACDRYGILVWHDFMFACAPYPDHLPWFVEEVRREADYQTKRLRNHACIALWSGSNENNWAFDEWWHGQTRSGAYLYNYLLPAIVRANCPEIPYWNGSPYGGETPNAPDVGDRHHWFDCMMNPDMNKRITPEEYDKCTALFISEYGYIGAPVKETVMAYLDGAPLDRQSPVWQHHNNTFEKNTVDAGIRKHYADPESISLDEYFLYSGLTQGLMYGYSLESFRARSNCYGGLFWMYADCWGEVGWTILDSYLRRKPAWYFVRRAFAPARLILRETTKGRVTITLVNDTPLVLKGILEYGVMPLDGRPRDQRRDLRRARFLSLPMTRSIVAEFRRGAHDPATHLWMARVTRLNTPEVQIIPATLRVSDVRNLKLLKPNLTLALSKAGPRLWHASVSSDIFAHAVQLTLPADALPEDNYFDLLPGETRTVLITSGRPLHLGQVGLTSVWRSDR